ncbi:MAG: CopL family metal-binding regulatory protein [Colwellia sp.]|nr:CopL family metal-binding regulatory protein [Colwellia sp.]
MPSFINKTVMVLLLCLIFIGQSMASMTMFYGMTAMQLDKQSMKSSHHNMSDMSDCDEDMMATSTMTCTSTTAEDCCAQECDCLTSGCSTASAFAAVINYSAERVTSNKITAATELVTSQVPTSLYRPPILS